MFANESGFERPREEMFAEESGLERLREEIFAEESRLGRSSKKNLPSPRSYQFVGIASETKSRLGCPLRYKIHLASSRRIVILLFLPNILSSLFFPLCN